MRLDELRAPNPRLQRTPSASPPSPLSRQPLGARKGQGSVVAAAGAIALVLSAIACVNTAPLLPRSKAEIHLIPAGYTGDVFILWGHVEGLPAEHEGAASVFRIPSDGILVTQDLPSPEWHTSSYYRTDATGARQLLTEEPSSVHDTAANRADRRPIVWFPRSGEWHEPDCSATYEMYYVGSRAELLARSDRDANQEELRFRKYVRRRGLCGKPGA